MAKQISASRYMEVSALTQKGFKGANEVFFLFLIILCSVEFNTSLNGI